VQTRKCTSGVYENNHSMQSQDMQVHLRQQPCNAKPTTMQCKAKTCKCTSGFYKD